MHLRRVQVPSFRALKNIDIIFELERIPRIFPLASQNGGGKSTLLQLVFILLTCCADKEKHQFLKNILKDFKINDESGCESVATIEILDGGDCIKFDFFYCTTSYLINKYLDPHDSNASLNEFGFANCNEQMQFLRGKIDSLDSGIAKTTNKELELENKKRNTPEMPSFVEAAYMPGLRNNYSIKLGKASIDQITIESAEIAAELARNKKDRKFYQDKYDECNHVCESLLKVKELLSRDNTKLIFSHEVGDEVNLTDLFKNKSISQKAFQPYSRCF
jgi:predicted ATP-binding protein involved in virulence